MFGSPSSFSRNPLIVPCVLWGCCLLLSPPPVLAVYTFGTNYVHYSTSATYALEYSGWVSSPITVSGFPVSYFGSTTEITVSITLTTRIPPILLWFSWAQQAPVLLLECTTRGNMTPAPTSTPRLWLIIRFTKLSTSPMATSHALRPSCLATPTSL